MSEFCIDLPGVPQPKGSTRAFRKGQRIIVTSANPKLRGWSDAAKWAVRAQWGSRLPLSCGVKVDVLFRYPKPKRPKASLPLVRPDVDKCLRAVLDVLTGIVVQDDALVVTCHAHKRYPMGVEVPGTFLHVTW